MPILLKTVLDTLLSTLGSMLIKYIANSKVIEKLVLMGLKKLVESTDSKVDDEALAIITAQVGEK